MIAAMGQIIATANLKGGTGKSTVAVNLACAFASEGRSVALLDVDPQQTAVAWAAGGKLPIHVLGEPPLDLHSEGRWAERAVSLARNTDIVIVDLPPLVGRVLASSLMVADLVLVPLTPSAVDVGPTEAVLRQIRIARESRQGRHPRALLIPNKIDPSGSYDGATRDAVDGLRERWAPPLGQHTDFVNAFAARTWVADYAPEGGAAKELAALKAAVADRLAEAAPAIKIPA